MTTTLTTPSLSDDMVLLVMLPPAADDQVMIVQTKRAQTIAELEAFLVAEYARVFPHKTPLSRYVRVQKCVPMAQVVNRRKRSHDQARGKVPQPQHCFVELSKTVQVGNVFENMEQIYVVHNHHHHQQTPGQAKLGSVPVAAEGKKHKKKGKNLGVPEQTLAEKTNESESASASPASSSASEERPSEPAKPTKRGPKARKAITDAAASTPDTEPGKPVGAEASTSEPPAKKAKIIVAKTSPASAPSNDEHTEAAPKAKRARKPKADAPADGEAERSAPTAKRSKINDEGPHAAVSKPAPRLSYLETLAAAKERIAAEKRAKEEAEKNAVSTDLPITSAAKDETHKVHEEALNTVDEAKEATPVTKAKKSTKNADASAKDTKTASKDDTPKPKKAAKSTEPSPGGTKAAKEETPKPKKSAAKEEAPKPKKAAATDETPKPKKAAKSTEPSLKANGTKAVTDAIKIATNALSDDSTQKAASPAKRSFKDVLEQTRARLDAEKKPLSRDEESDEETTDSSDAPQTKALPKSAASNKASKVTSTSVETLDSSPSSDSDFEDPKSNASVVVKPSTKPAPKASAASSDESTDDEGLDYSQSLLADLTKSDEAPKKPTTPASQSPKASTGAVKRRGRPPKTKVVLPGADADLAPESSQESAMDLSQDLLSQKNPETNSVLISSLSKNRFSLDNIPVAKLRKTTKNPFAAAGTALTKGDKSGDQPKRRGRSK